MADELPLEAVPTAYAGAAPAAAAPAMAVQLTQVRVFPLGELAVLLELLRDPLTLAPGDDRLFELGALLRQAGELAPIGDDRGIGYLPLELLEAPLDLPQTIEHASARARRAGRHHAVADRHLRRTPTRPPRSRTCG